MRGTNLSNEHGQTLSEYAVILGVITAGILLALVFLRSQIVGVLQRVADLVG